MFHNLKICGITTSDIAQFCAASGVGAIGAVFYPPSLRHLTPEQARAIFLDLPSSTAKVGVFVDAPLEQIFTTAHIANLSAIQLHGHESNDTILALQHAGLHVIKVLRETGQNLIESYIRLPPNTKVLVECGTGALPGGNAASWDWSAAAPLARHSQFAVAGGLAPDSIATAMRVSGASAWDISSGVESAPGVKDSNLIKKLLDAVREVAETDNGFLATAPGFWGGVNQPLKRS